MACVEAGTGQDDKGTLVKHLPLAINPHHRGIILSGALHMNAIRTEDQLPIPFAGGNLDQYRHVCAFFDS
ncbi:MAG: hypothetical protein JWO42_1687, partial [Chloroflexi bacterium]|nr:hypothetical protein [Chloroflexota bacterium]